MPATPSSRDMLNPGVARREVAAWTLFDFANSGYTTVVISTVFNAYFVAVVAGDTPWATLAWSAALSVSYFLVMLTAPAIGAYADARLAKKRLLVITVLGCAAATAALGLAGPGELWLAVLLVVISNYFFSAGENLIAAFLPELARGRGLGRVSGLGWGVGYFGGMLTLAICLAYVSYAQAQGRGADDYVPMTLLITAGLFVLASLPTFLLLRERGMQHAAAAAPEAVQVAVQGAYRRMLRSMRRVRDYPDLARFLTCLVAFQAGVMAVIALAAVYAQQVMGFDTRETIQLVMLVNVAAAVSALSFGFVQDRIGHKRAVAVTLLGWLTAVLLLWRADDMILFWLGAVLVGMCMGTSQSAGRALIGFLSPVSHRAEFYGLWGWAVKLASILGPISYGLAVWLAGGEHRPAMLVLGGFFLLGLWLLKDIDLRRGRRRALRGDRVPARGV